MSVIYVTIGDISYVERNGILYGGVGVEEGHVPFIFLLTDYKRFEDYDNAGTWNDDWTLEGAATPEESYLIEQANLLPPLNEHVRLVDLVNFTEPAYTNAGYENFADGSYGFLFTFIYDGFQESGIKDVEEDIGITSYLRIADAEDRNDPGEIFYTGQLRGPSQGLSYVVETTSNNAITFKLELNVAKIPRRVTGINIYMNFLGGLFETYNRSEIRLVKTIPIDNKQTYLGRSSALVEYWPTGYTSKWDDQTLGWWRFVEEPRNSSTIYISKQDFLYGKPWVPGLGFNATTKLSPHYKYNHVLNDVMYAGPVSYLNKDGGEWEYFSNIFVWSPPGQFSILPFTNRGIIKGEITGINSIGDSLMVFTLSDLFIFKNNAQDDVKPGLGCYSHHSVVGHSNYRYWAGKSGFIRFDGFKGVKISNYFVENSYKGLNESQKKTISGEYFPDNEQIIWTIPNVRTYVYNLKDDSWAIRDYGFNALKRNTTLDVYATDGTDVFKLGDTYQYDGTDYTSTYTLKNLDSGQPNIVKTATLGFCQYKSLSAITLKFYTLDKLLTTVTLPATSGVRTLHQFKLGINAESYDVQITANGSSEYQIEFIDVWGEVNDVKGN